VASEEAGVEKGALVLSLFCGLQRGWLVSREPFEVGFDIIEVHHVDILMMQVEQIDLVDQFRTVVGAFLNDRNVKSVRIGVYRAGADAARRALAADNETADAKQIQVRQERRSLEDAGAL